jgi:RNA polymerase sigma-32 factor
MITPRSNRPSRNFRRLTPEQERDLFAVFRRGRQPNAKPVERARAKRAANTIADAVAGLAFRLAAQYSKNGRVEFDDLVAAGKLGIAEAMEQFDHTRGVRFSTFVQWNIRGNMLTLIQKHLGLSRWADRQVFLNLGRAERRLHLLGLSSDPGRVADAINRMARERGASWRYDVKADDVEYATHRIQGNDLPLDAPLDGGATVGDQFRIEADSPEDVAAHAEGEDQARRTVERALLRLTVRERRIIRERHLVPEPKTLERLGALMGVTRERVRQLEKRAMGKLSKAVKAFVKAPDNNAPNAIGAH